MRKISLLAVIFLICSFSGAEAVFMSGSTGADGAFNPTTTTELQLPPDGIFNFTTVNIPSGVTVTFQKNAANTPVYILASGDVSIAGTVSVNGGSVSSPTAAPGVGGPSGFRGGYGGASGMPGGNGLGPGGGQGAPSAGHYGGGGSFGTVGVNGGGPVYGNERLLPMIGGSGGGGTGAGSSAGGGGGAILIASSTTISVTGSITAKGGVGYYSAGGSGGAIKLMANTISGNGVVSASGGTYYGGAGRIRLECFTNNRTSATDPLYSFGQPGTVFVANTPSLQITTIAGAAVPSNPTGSYAQPDIMLPSSTTNPVTVALAASNIPVGTVATVSVIPQNGSVTNVNATLSGSDASSTASASVNLSTQYANVIMAKATYTLQLAMNYEGERIDKVMVATTAGQGSKTVYITESGRQIPSEELLAKLMN